VLHSGALRYEASGAYHDDLIAALCLAREGVGSNRQPWVEVVSADAEDERGWRRIN
jgi:hypothetical protein